MLKNKIASLLMILKKNIIISILIIAILLLGFYTYHVSKENSYYDEYTSHVLSNDIIRLASTIAVNDFYLNQILDEGEITQEQIDILQENYQIIGDSGETVVKMATLWLHRLNTEEMNYNHSSFPINWAYQFKYYFENHLNEYESNNGVMELSSEDLSKLELMNEVTQQWKSAVFSNIKSLDDNLIDKEYLDFKGVDADQTWTGVATDGYTDTYYRNMVNTNDWVDMVEEMQRNSIDYETEVKNSF
ncbi:hypothetical protein [Alkalibacillus aidingensis]|uniref:hypothetical protein n=1 Tax=Alkalibacillus aidingensis TaxID=2747607 RepID=UPI001660D152|nr:hypothetical protein [Alkalibacillus aidingensis]